jgi:RNA polymerase sigma factor (sigma-70 family)
VLSDAALSRLALEGRSEAFTELVRRASPIVGDLLRRMGAPDAFADDIVQDAMIAAHRYLAGYRGDAAFATWTMRIAARLYVKRRRKEMRWKLMAEPVGPDVAAACHDGPARMDLDRALAQLSEPERLCVSLCHGAGLTHAEIAESLNTPLGTVKSHVNRGLAKLRRLMRSDTDG